MRAHFLWSSLAVSTLAASCGGGLPDELPRTAAASPEARSARPRAVARSLESDPPLPGESVEGWTGLEEDGAEPAEPGHDHHHHHHGSKP